MQWVVYTVPFSYIPRKHFLAGETRLLTFLSEKCCAVSQNSCYGSDGAKLLERTWRSPKFLTLPSSISLTYIYVLYRLLFFYFASRTMKTAFGSLSILSLYFSLYVIFYLQFPSFSSRNTCYLYVLRRRYAFVIIVPRFPVFRNSREIISFFLFMISLVLSIRNFIKLYAQRDVP